MDYRYVKWMDGWMVDEALRAEQLDESEEGNEEGRTWKKSVDPQGC